MRFKDEILLAHMALNEGEEEEALEIFNQANKDHPVQAFMIEKIWGLYERLNRLCGRKG